MCIVLNNLKENIFKQIAIEILQSAKLVGYKYK